MVARAGGKLDWDKLRVFHAVAEAGSFTHASDALALSQSAVSRQIGALEESLGVSLFHRHARGLILTEQGDLLYKTVHDVFAKLNSVEDLLTETKESPEGPLRITTTVAFGSVWLTPRLKEFIRAYPRIEVSLRLDDRELDLAMREADVAIRFTPPSDPNLIQRHAGSMKAMLFASPEYLKERGNPRTLADLAHHDIVVFGDGGVMPFPEVNWFADLLDRDGIAARKALRVNNIYGMYRAVKNGIGIASLPEYFYREGRGLVHVLTEVEGFEVHGYFVYPQELKNSARVEAFRDFLLMEVARARSETAKVVELAKGTARAAARAAAKPAARARAGS